MFPSIEQVDLTLIRCYNRVIGWALDTQELTALLAIVKFLGVEKFLEIGIFDDFTALNVAANLGESAQVVTVDLPPGVTESQGRPIFNAVGPAVVGSQFRGTPHEAHFRQVLADSTRLDYATLPAPFDAIIIDGCHDYEFVREDTEKAMGQVRPGGILLWHDYGEFAGATRVVGELARTHDCKAILGTRLAVARF